MARREQHTPAGPGAPTVKKRERADQLLVAKGLAESRARAQSLILAGRVYEGERRVEKSGERLTGDATLTVRQGERFVSRGGEKLDGALDDFALDVTGLRAADIGASTGGFTDCLLKRGAAHVAAVDVGHGQLAAALRNDARVSVHERTNARHLTPGVLGAPVDLVVVDASFIGIHKLLDGIVAVLRPGGTLIALVKPQFEAGREEVARGRGVIRDEGVRLAAVAEARKAVERAGFEVLGEADSRLAGPKGNRERFLMATLRANGPRGQAQSTSTQTS